MRIYISGKITGDENYQKKFAKAEDFLRNRYRCEVVNPARLGNTFQLAFESIHEKAPEWADYMKHDIGLLLNCTHIYLLPDWEKSKGARVENAVAKEMGIVRVLR